MSTPVFVMLVFTFGLHCFQCGVLPWCFQMGAYKSDMNYVQFGAVLKSRGPYRWVNILSWLCA